MNESGTSLAPAGHPLGLAMTNGAPQIRSEYTELMEIAQRAPDRDDAKLMTQARAIGEILALTGETEGGGTDAYYRFRIGGNFIEGPTVDLLEALEKIWKNTMTTVDVDQEIGNRVTFRCQFIDFQTGTFKRRPFTGVITQAPGKFAKDPEQAERWRNMQLQSATSKATRTMLEHGLPRWLTNSAMAGAKAVAFKSVLGGDTLEQAVAKAVDAWTRAGITVAELEGYLEMSKALWSPGCLVELRDLWRAIAGKQTTAEEVFGPIRERMKKGPAAESAPAALPPASPSATDSLGLNRIPQEWAAEFASATDAKGLDQVKANARKALPAEMHAEIDRAYLQASERAGKASR